ncbi:MAG: DNA polymerase Y family protein [Pseudomonadota bacterium]
MYWIALQPSHDDERTAWGWRALQFTPQVAWAEDALLLEVQASEKLWGGRRRLLRQLLKAGEVLAPATWAAGATALVALALLRLKLRGEAPPANVPDGLPLDVLAAAREHLPMLERIGCRGWGQLRALPRGGLARRFGPALLAALDCAYGERPERYMWIELPESFDVKVELPALATSAPELMWAGQRLLSQLQVWLQARNRGVLAFELEWTLDLRRLDGKPLPPTERLEVRTAQPTQEMAHLRRMVNEQLARVSLGAPANHLRLRSLDTVPWGGRSTSLLPEDNRPGEKLHQFIERLSARLGEHNVLVPRMCEEHRPEGMQAWVPAKLPLPSGERAGVRGASGDAIYPPWLLPQPQLLPVQGDSPHYMGRLRLITRLYRVETAWWEEGGPALRDYFIARSEEAGLVWIFRERALKDDAVPEHERRDRWYLQGLYA